MNRSLVVGATLFLAVLAFCLLLPLVSPHGADAVDLTQSRQGPSVEHPLGTDQLGRDLLTRLAVGGRTTLVIAFSALTLILALGLVYGTVAGLAGGVVDSVLMRVLDGLFALPRLLISIVILVVLGLNAQNVPAVVFALGIAGWMLTARLVRGEVRSLKRRDYVLAARAAGARGVWIARRHVIPNSFGIVVVAVFLELPAVVLGEAFLALLGLGPSPPTATWGNITLEGIQFFRFWVAFLPTLAIALFALSANLLADGLHDTLDPRRRAQRARRSRLRRRALRWA